VAEPRYADVLSFHDCSDLTIENVTLGHTVEQGSCEGAVLEFNNCRNVTLDGLDLYGCGTYGVAAHRTVGITLADSVIRECSYGILDLSLCSGVLAKDCTFRDNDGYDLLSLYTSYAVFDGCSFTGNAGSRLLPYHGDDSGARFDRCDFGSWESRQLNEELKGRGGYVIGGDCRFNVTLGKRIAHVADLEQLIEHIAPDTEILLAPGEYDLSETLVRLWNGSLGRFNESHEFVRITQEYDGLQLTVTGVDGLTIASESGSAAVILSDGAARAENVAERLRTCAPEGLQALASAILSEAAAQGGWEDDMTVLTLSLRKREEPGIA